MRKKKGTQRKKNERKKATKQGWRRRSGVCS
jgi:hypothetical protein